MWSDYGFEGVLSSANLHRLANWGLFAVGASSLAFSGCVWAARHRDTDQVVARWKQDVHGLRADYRKRDLNPFLLKSLRDLGLESRDLLLAASRLTPVEGQLLAANGVLSELRDESGGLDDVCERCPDPIVRRLVRQIAADCKTIEALEERVFKELVGHWYRNRYFDSTAFPNRSIFQNRETGEAIGVDIGCTVLSGMGDNTSRVLSVKQISEAARMVEQWGFTFVTNAVSPESIENLTGTLRMDQGSASSIGEKILRLDPNVSHSRAMPNRLHLVLRGSKLEALTESFHSAVLPLITTLQSRREPSGPSLMLSDLRLIVVDQAAQATNWTLLNPRGGYTVLVPIHHRNTLNGTYSLLPGSHFLPDSSLNVFRRIYLTAQRLLSFPQKIRITDFLDDGCWRAGDALVIDNRLIVQAEENRLFKSGTYLLMKYETPSVSPNAVYLSGKITYRVAQFLQLIGSWSHPH